jgi:hypothetical protein
MQAGTGAAGRHLAGDRDGDDDDDHTNVSGSAMDEYSSIGHPAYF